MVFFAGLILDFRQQQLRIVVAITQLATVRIDPAADQVQVLDVLVTRDLAQLVGGRGERAVGVVAVSACGAARQRGMDQSSHGIPLRMRDGAVFVLLGNPPPQFIVGKLSRATYRQRFFNELAQRVPDEQVPAVIRVTDR